MHAACIRTFISVLFVYTECILVHVYEQEYVCLFFWQPELMVPFSEQGPIGLSKVAHVVQ